MEFPQDCQLTTLVRSGHKQLAVFNEFKADQINVWLMTYEDHRGCASAGSDEGECFPFEFSCALRIARADLAKCHVLDRIELKGESRSVTATAHGRTDDDRRLDATVTKGLTDPSSVRPASLRQHRFTRAHSALIPSERSTAGSFRVPHQDYEIWFASQFLPQSLITRSDCLLRKKGKN